MELDFLDCNEVFTRREGRKEIPVSGTYNQLTNEQCWK